MEIICPACGSPEYRLSRHAKSMDRLHTMRGQVAYRCRSCHHRFFGMPANEQIANQSEKSRKREMNRGGRRRRRRAQILLTVTIFAICFVMFVLLLFYLTSEGGHHVDDTKVILPSMVQSSSAS